MAGGLNSLNLVWCYTCVTYTKRIRRPYYTGACVAIFVGLIEHERSLKLITEVWEFVQVFTANLQYIKPMDVGYYAMSGTSPKNSKIQKFNNSTIEKKNISLVQLKNAAISLLNL